MDCNDTIAQIDQKQKGLKPENTDNQESLEKISSCQAGHCIGASGESLI